MHPGIGRGSERERDKTREERTDERLMSFNTGIYSFSINWNLGDNLSSH